MVVTTLKNNLPNFPKLKNMNNNTMKNNKEVNQQEKAVKVLELSEGIRETKIKRKTLMRAYTEEIKRQEAELEAVLTDEPTSEELIQKDIHDLEVVK